MKTAVIIQIPQGQNTPLQLERLVAQRQLYSDAKNIQNINIILSIPCVILWSILIAIFSNLQIYAALWGLSVTLLEQAQELERESYILQNQIYDNRRLSPLIFDWLYSRLKQQNEEQMNKGAEVLIKELLQTP